MKKVSLLLIVLAMLTGHGVLASGAERDGRSGETTADRLKEDKTIENDGKAVDANAKRAQEAKDKATANSTKLLNAAKRAQESMSLADQLKKEGKSLKDVQARTSTRDALVEDSYREVQSFTKEVTNNSGDLAKKAVGEIQTAIDKIKSSSNLKYKTTALGILSEMTKSLEGKEVNQGGVKQKLTTAYGARLISASARALAGMNIAKESKAEKFDNNKYFINFTSKVYLDVFRARVAELRASMEAKAGEVSSANMAAEVEKITNGLESIYNRTADLTGRGLTLREALYTASKEYARDHHLDADAVFRCVTQPNA